MSFSAERGIGEYRLREEEGDPRGGLLYVRRPDVTCKEKGKEKGRNNSRTGLCCFILTFAL